MIELTTGIAFLLSSLYGAGHPISEIATANAISSSNTNNVEKSNPIVISTDRKSVEKYIRERFADTPILIEIAKCESTFMQFDKNGNIIRGNVNKADVGVMQINEKYHLETSKKLGMDIYTIEGNTAYGKHLYEEFGAEPWKASSPCWGKTLSQGNDNSDLLASNN